MSKPVASLFLIGALSLAGQCRDFPVEEALRLGVQSYKTANYAEAAEHFEKAVAGDPRCVIARVYMASAYAQQYIPGAASPKNVAMGERAIEEFKKVLDEHPNDANSIAAIASMYFNMKKLDDAKTWYEKQIVLDPTNPEAYYSVGVIGWSKAYPARMKVKAEHNLPPDQPMDDWIRELLCKKNLPIIEEAMRNLERAIELRPDYDDAMAYLNLMFREKADCQADFGERAKMLQTANEWVEKTLATKKKKAEASDGNNRKQ